MENKYMEDDAAVRREMEAKISIEYDKKTSIVLFFVSLGNHVVFNDEKFMSRRMNVRYVHFLLSR